MQVKVHRKSVPFSPDKSRIISRFLFSTECRSIEIVKTLLAMPEIEVQNTLKPLFRDFATRHRNITKVFEKHFNKLGHLFPKLELDGNALSYWRKMLIGSYFTTEYSVESAAFYNPSMVEDPDQSGLGKDEKRVIISFRATGEGNISSIVFRSGVLDQNNNLKLEPRGNLISEADCIKPITFNKRTVLEKLSELALSECSLSASVLKKLGDYFTFDEFMSYINEMSDINSIMKDSGINELLSLVSSQNEIDFSIDSDISERVIFPISASEEKGFEDARFVKFSEDNGEICYYAIYSSSKGSKISSNLIKTIDFYHFETIPMHGEITRYKGMCLFPRKINGKYAILCQIDGVNNYIAYSDKINIWREAKLLQVPKYPWELMKIGNAGSPIETDAGWLVITNAVGPMNKSVISASLFESDNPEKEIGRLKFPLIMPNESEREGCVPNVLFSCGSIVNADKLIIPYSMSDHTSTYATVNLKALLHELKTTACMKSESIDHEVDRIVNYENESDIMVA